MTLGVLEGHSPDCKPFQMGYFFTYLCISCHHTVLLQWQSFLLVFGIIVLSVMLHKLSALNRLTLFE